MKTLTTMIIGGLWFLLIDSIFASVGTTTTVTLVDAWVAIIQLIGIIALGVLTIMIFQE